MEKSQGVCLCSGLMAGRLGLVSPSTSIIARGTRCRRSGTCIFSESTQLIILSFFLGQSNDENLVCPEDLQTSSQRKKNQMKCDYSVFISKLVSKDTSTSLQNKLIQPN